MDVFLADEQELPVDDVRLTALARHALAAEDMEDGAELSLLLVGEEHMRRLNARFAGNDYSTDVLAFPMMEDEEEGTLLLGDIVICPSVAERNAHKLGHPAAHEMDTLVVHGLLHLIGYDHQGSEDKKRMDKRLTEVLGSFNPTAI